MRKEAAELRKNHIEKRIDFTKTLQDLYDASHVYCKDRSKLKEEIIKNEDEIKKITMQLKILEQNFKKKDSVFSKYIQSLKDAINEELKGTESYWELNSSLITEKDFEGKVQDELLKIIKLNFYGEDLFEKENIIKQYFIELENREKNIQKLMFEHIEAKKDLEEAEYKLNEVNNQYEKNTNESLRLESQYNDILYNRENIINTRVESRNQGLSKHLQSYTAEEFEKYLSVNKNLYKQILRKYSSFDFRQLSKSEKDIFYSLVIDDHSTKKNKYFDLIGQVIYDDAITDSWESTKDELFKVFCKNSENYSKLKEDIKLYENEIHLLNESKEELKGKMELTLKNQIYELESEKKDLQVKYNINFYKFNIKELSERIDELKLRLEKFKNEYDKGEEEYNVEMDKLSNIDKELKKELIEYGIAQNNEINNTKILSQNRLLRMEEDNKDYKYNNIEDYYNNNNKLLNKRKPGKNLNRSLEIKKDIKKNSISPNHRNNISYYEDQVCNMHSITNRSKSIDFEATLNCVNNEYRQIEKEKGGLEDLKIINSDDNKDSDEKNSKHQEDPFFINIADRVSIIYININK